MKKTALLILAFIIFTSSCSTAQATISPVAMIEASPVSIAPDADTSTAEALLPTPPKLLLNTSTPLLQRPFIIEITVKPEPLLRAPNLLELPEIPESPESEKPMIALTFDDGPSSDITPRIVEVLKENDARATFCVVGRYLEKHREIGVQIFESGCEIIGHSWNHSYLTKLSAEAAQQQLFDTNALIEEITGKVPAFYRPPYGAVNSKVREISEELGLSLLMWSVDPRDWKTRDAKAIYEHVLENVTEGCIIICHDLYESTLEAVEMLVPELIDRGYRFVTISELFSDAEVVPGKTYISQKQER